MKPQSPCKDCEGRKVGCHADCEKYQGYCVELEEWKQTVKVEKEDGKEAKAFRRSSYERIHGKGGQV